MAPILGVQRSVPTQGAVRGLTAVRPGGSEQAGSPPRTSGAVTDNSARPASPASTYIRSPAAIGPRTGLNSAPGYLPPTRNRERIPRGLSPVNGPESKPRVQLQSPVVDAMRGYGGTSRLANQRSTSTRPGSGGAASSASSSSSYTPSQSSPPTSSPPSRPQGLTPVPPAPIESQQTLSPPPVSQPARPTGLQRMPDAG